MRSDIIDQLFSQYYNEALLYSISLCKNRTVAEDIVSNAFFKALSMSDDSIRDFKPWLLTVCRNEFISICRKESRFTGDEPRCLSAEYDSGLHRFLVTTLFMRYEFYVDALSGEVLGIDTQPLPYRETPELISCERALSSVA